MARETLPNDRNTIVSLDDFWKDPNKFGNYVGDKLANLTRKAGSTVTGTPYKSIQQDRIDLKLQGKSMYAVPIAPPSSSSGDDGILMVLGAGIFGLLLLKILFD